MVAELGADIRPGNFDGQLGAGHPLAETQHVTVVVLHALMGGVRVAGVEGARPGHLVGRDARACARAAHHDGAVRVATYHGLSGGPRVVRIIHRWSGGIRAQIDKRHIRLGGQSIEEQHLELIAGVVRSDGDAHG